MAYDSWQPQLIKANQAMDNSTECFGLGACFFARIVLTGTVLTDNGGASVHHTVDQKIVFVQRHAM